MRTENHGFADENSRRQGNHNMKFQDFTNGKGKRIMDSVEGTGSNELMLSSLSTTIYFRDPYGNLFQIQKFSTMKMA